MRVAVYKEGEPKNEPIKLQLIENGEQVCVTIANGEGDFQWVLVSFSIKAGKLVMQRDTGVDDNRVSLDYQNAIVEI